MPHTWINEPPVVETTNWEELSALCHQFLDETGKFGRLAPDELGAWRHRKRWTESMVRYIKEVAAANPDYGVEDMFFVYKPLGKPVGLMKWWISDFEEEPMVPWLAMLPGHDSDGAVLV